MAENIRIFATGFVLVTSVLVFYVTGFPICDLLYSWTVASGQTAETAYSFVWWILYLFVVVNVVHPALLMGVIAGYKNPVRIDLHTIFTIFTIIINALVFVALTIFIFVLVDTSYSGGFPFNDYRWCCVFWGTHPELCPNSGPCVPPLVHADLHQNGEFTILWAFSIVFLFVSIFHLGINELLRVTGAVVPPGNKSEEGTLMGLLVSAIYVGIFAYWAAFPLLDTLYLDGYPLMGIPPSPGAFVSTLYDWQWWFIWFLLSNVIPPIVFFMVVLLPPSVLATRTHFWLTVVVSVASALTFLVLLGILFADCNWAWAGRSICADYKWCCVHFGSAPDICPNVGPCTADLFPNGEFIQHVVFALIFSAFALVQLWLNFRMRKYGVFE